MDDLEIEQLDRLESSHFWYRARKDQLSNWLLNTQPKPRNVLDLGSATGGNTLHLLSMGYRVTSVEYSEIGITIQRKKGLPVIRADARCLPFKDESFDLVICLDVLEHIVEDYRVADEIYRVLAPDGRFLISVPEDPALWSDHDVSVNHVRRYLKSDLIDVIQASKLSIHQIWSTLFLLRPLILVARKFTKGSNLKKLNVIVNLILLAICKLELVFPKFRGKGVTLWISGQKNAHLNKLLK